MECPNCKHATSDTALLQCSHCGEAFERRPFEEFEHLNYLETWLKDRSEISSSQKNELLQIVRKKQKKLLVHLLPRQKPVEEISIPAPAAKAETVQQAQTVQAPLPRPVVKPVPKPAPVSVAKPAVVQVSKPVAPPKPAQPPKPKRPPVDWKKVRDGLADAVTSGALLRALLYLGAFMIVISATVLVIRFWNTFSPALQLIFIASIPLMFYSGGWALRTRLKLVQGGTVLTGIGAVLVAVDFAAIYQFGGIAGQVNGPAYWLAVSLFCTALYTFTAWRLQGEFFDYLTLIGGASILFALTRVIKPAPHLAWTVTTVTLSGVVMTILAGMYWNKGDAWRDFARASRYLSQVLIPASVFYVFFSMDTLPIAIAFLLATIGYIVLASRFPSTIFVYFALLGSIGTVLSALQYASIKPEWYALAGSFLALAYLFISQRVNRSKADAKVVKNYTRSLNTFGIIILSLAATAGFFISFFEVWAGVLAMTVATVDLVFCSYLFKHSRYTFLAAGLFMAPYTISVWQWFMDAQISHPIGWLAAAWAGLSMVYLGMGIILRPVDRHGRWLYLFSHGLMLFSLGILPIEYMIAPGNWNYISSFTTLGLALVFYLMSTLIHHTGKHPGLSQWVDWIPLGIGKSIFLWFSGLLFPVWVAIGWNGNGLNEYWLGVLIATIGLAYIGGGQWLRNYAKEYRLPLHTFSYFLLAIGILNAIPDTHSFALSDRYPLLFSLSITFISLVALAYFHNRVAETTLAGVIFIWVYTLALDMMSVSQTSHGIAFVLLAGLVYIPFAVWLKVKLNDQKRLHHVPVFVIGYAISLYAVFSSIYWSINGASTSWIGAVTPILAAGLYIFSVYQFRNEEFGMSGFFGWVSVITLALAFRQTLTLFNAPAKYDPLAWILFAGLYMITERLLSQSSGEEKRTESIWSGFFRLPLFCGWILLAGLGFSLDISATLAAFRGTRLIEYFPVILGQTTLVLLLIASARFYRSRIPLLIEPVVAFLLVTLFFIGYGEQIFGSPLLTQQFALVWTGLGAVHFIAAIFTDRAKERYSHALHLGGYVLLSWAVVWSMIDRTILVWSFGSWVLTAVISALLVHFNRHQTWDDLVQLVFGKLRNKTRTHFRNLFQWLAAWSFPVWCVILLRELNVSPAFAWFGLVVPPLAYLGLALWTRRIDPAYAPPLYSSAHFFTFIGLVISAPATFDYLISYDLPLSGKSTLLAYIILQTLVVAFYAIASWMSKSRFFSHVAAWLSISAFSLAWQVYGFELTPKILIVPWLIWAIVLLAVGFMLDKKEVRYAHGPYLAAYVLMVYALTLSTSIRLTNIYALAITIVVAIVSHGIVHFGRHHSFEDFIRRFWMKKDETTNRIVSTIFLFYAAYAFPVLLTQVLAYIKLDLPWRGVTLAIAAPLYIAVGLVISRSKPRSIPVVSTWPLFSAGYALTAVGAMVSFGDERLAIYVLSLNAIVYAVSSYIFRQSFWLYLSTILVPVISLLTLHYNEKLETGIVAWMFISFAFVYLAIGQLFDRRGKDGGNSDIHPFAVPFYAPGFLLSAIALALASSNRELAMGVYTAGVILYALSSVLFRETLFYYPAAWLAAVPYYLGVTLTSLETRWYGLAWLPLIVLYIALGRFVFHKKQLVPLGKGFLANWLTHPAVPFYILAYGLSISMVSLSYGTPLSLTIAFGSAAIIYFVSAYLFRKPAWIYPALFAAHMTVLAYFTINPSGGPMRRVTLPFLAMTWFTSLIGYAFERRTPLTDENRSYRFSFLNRLFGHSWARPFFAFAIFEMFVWQSIALTGSDTAIIVSSGHALLFALFSLLWMEGPLVYGAVAFGLIAVGASLKQAGVQFADAVAVYGGIGFGLYLFSRILDALSARIKSLTVWLTPLTHSSIVLTGAAVIINLPTVTNHMTATAATFAFAGALYVAIAYRGRMYRLGYLGMALLELAWVLALIINDVAQPQWYAIPGGLYFVGLGYMEWLRSKSKYAVGLEILGLGVLLVTSFAQSLNGKEGFPYFVLLLIEGILVILWGVYQKRKVPFFTGIGASALNIIAQVILLVSVYNVSVWYVGFTVGLIIMAVAIYIERSREKLRARARELSETLEKWE